MDESGIREKAARDAVLDALNWVVSTNPKWAPPDSAICDQAIADYDARDAEHCDNCGAVAPRGSESCPSCGIDFIEVPF